MAHRRARVESGAALRRSPRGPVGTSSGSPVVRMLVACLLVAAGLAASAVEARASAEAIAGWENDEFGQGYAFLTGAWLVRTSTAAALPVRLTASYLYYEYMDGAGEVKVQAPGASLLSGAQWAGRSGYVSMMAGAEVRRERREPEAGEVRVVTLGGFVGQIGAGFSSGRFQPQALAVYTGASDYVYARGALRWQCSNVTWAGPRTWFAGLEGVTQGNADVDAIQAGAVLECVFTHAHLSLSVRGGKKWASTGGDRRPGGYFGFGLYRAF